MTPETHASEKGSALRIAAHNGAPEWGGAEIAVSRLLAGLQARGHAVRFFCARALVADRARTFGLETARLHVGGDVALHHAVRVARALRAWRADVLLVGTFRKLLHLTLGARLAGVPVVARIGLSSDLPRNAKYRLLVRHGVDRVVVTSAEVELAWREAMPELDAARIVLVPKGIEAPAPTTAWDMAREARRRELDLDAGDLVVLGLARLVEQKRLDRFIDVFAHLPPAARGVVAGDGPLRDDLEIRARQRGAPVLFLGHVQEVGDLLAAADVLLLTSDREAMANAMLEAMAAGVPVVSTPVAGADEALAGAESDVPPGRVSVGFEVADIASTLEPLLLDHELRRAMGRAAAQRAHRLFGTGRMLDGWEHLLREVAGSPGGGA